MQTWAKRGIQTALVTGGLLMLGTGIASADEDVNPDRPASPLDGSVSVPFNIDNNAIGTPLGQMDAPSVTNGVTVNLSDVTGNTPGVATDAFAPVTGFGDDPFRGNRIAGDLAAPVDISGNAIAAGGTAKVENTSARSATVTRPQLTSGARDTLGGNVVDLDYALPVQITGNAGSVVGNAAATSTSTQEAAATGDIRTDGCAGTLAGNVVAPQGATPVQVNGNAIAGAGTAQSTVGAPTAEAGDVSGATTSGTAGGWIATCGESGTVAGNAGAVPLAFPVEVNDNSVGAAAAADADSVEQATATAGDTMTGAWDRPTYIQTNGKTGTLSGNVAQGAAAGPATVNCNSGAGLAVTESECATSSPTTAGGTTQTDGTRSLVSGSILNPAVALPIDAFANPAAVGGEATAIDANTTDSSAGGDNFTHGADSTVGGTVVGPTASGPADVFTNAGAGAGSATAGATNDTTTTSGGFSGTSGPGSTAGGNTAVVPVTLPTEGIGNVAGAAGTATSTATETKVSSSGGTTSTNDDGGLGAANLVQGAASGPVQVAGNGGGVLGNTTSLIDADNTVTAGGDNKATGKAGTLAGNVGQAAVSLPGQLFANNVTGGGVGTAEGGMSTESTAGGVILTDGAGGLGTGNVVNAPVGSAAQGFGDSAAALGLSNATANSVTDSTAGGDTTTDGTAGTVAGNVITGQALPVAQGFGAAAAGVGGVNGANGTNVTDVDSGGDVATDGTAGTISGNLVDAPLAVILQAFADAVSAVGSDATGLGDNSSTGEVGGSSTTGGSGGFLSGIDATLPLGADVPVYKLPVEVVAEALAEGTNASDFTVGDADPTINTALSGDSVDGLGITQMPKLLSPSGNARTAAPVPGLGGLGNLGGLMGLFRLLGGLPGGLPGGAGGLPVGGLTGGLPGGAGGLPVGGLTGGLPVGGLTGGAGGLPVGGLTGGLPGGAGGVPVDADLPVVNGLTGGLSGGGGDLTSAVPGVGMLSATPSLVSGGFGRIPGVPGVPAASGLAGATHALPVPAPRTAMPVHPVPGLDELTDLPALDQLTGSGTLDEITTLVGTLFDGGLPAAGALPGLPEVPGMNPTPGLPGPAGLPGLPGAPQVPDLPTTRGVPQVPDLTDAQLLDVPDAGELAGPVVSVVDNSVPGGSFSDTRARLAWLLGEIESPVV
jgi:hypothetical protein